MAESVLQDLRVAVRQLLREPAFSVVAIGTLAVGMAAATLVFTAINAVLLRPLPVRQPETLVAVSSAGEMAFLQQEPLTFGDFVDLSREVPSLAATVAHRRAPSVIGEGVDARVALGELVSPSYFETLGVAMTLGRPFGPTDDSDTVVVLGHAVWRQRFGGDPQVLGRQIVLSGKPRTVVGVAPEGFTGLFRGIAPEFWIPFAEAQRGDGDRENPSWWVLARLTPGATLEQVRAQVEGVASALAARYPTSNTGRAFRVIPLEEASVHPAVPAALANAGALGILVVALLVLAVACVNVANLVLARGVLRGRDMAVRAAMGATRGRLVRQLFIEGLVLATSAGVVALTFAAWAGRALTTVALPVAIRIEFHLAPDWRVFAFTLAVAFGTAAVFSIGPALRTIGQPLVTALASGTRGATSLAGARWRGILLGGQAAVATVLLILGSLALRSLSATTDADPGFAVEGVTVVSASPELGGHDQARALSFLNDAASRTRALPGVEAVGWMHPLPLSLNIRITRLQLPGQEGTPPRELPFVDAAVAGPGAFGALGIPLVEGREFTDRDRLGGPGVAIVNEAFARRYWPADARLGQRISVGFPDVAAVEVVGVVRDFKNRTLGSDPRPMVFTSGLQDAMGWRTSTLVVRQSADARPVLTSVQESLRAVDPGVPLFDGQSMRIRMSGVLALPRYAAGLFGGIGILALGLVAVGLFGAVSFWVATRTRELGLRLALGGGRAAILWLVINQTLRPIGLGVAGGVVAAVVSARGMTSLLYGVSPGDPMASGLGAALLLAISVGASAWPAWRATRLDPMTTLRAD